MTQYRPSNFQFLPIVIKNLLIINVLFYFAQQTFSAQIFPLEDYLGLHHVNSPLFQPWQLVTYLFLHGDFFHLFANMFALWMFGAILENQVWGPKRFFTFYFLCGIGAGLIQLGFLWIDYKPLLDQFLIVKSNPTAENFLSFYRQFGLINDQRSVALLQNYLSDNSSSTAGDVVNYISQYTNARISTPTIGASGAIFGILAAFVYLYPNTYIYLYFLFPIKAKWIGLAYFGYELYSGLLNGVADNVAHWAHVGGGLVGFLLVLTWNKRSRRRSY